MKLTLSLLLFIFMLGCSVKPVSQAEADAREYKQEERKEQWRLCKAVYRSNGVPTMHRHSHKRGREHKAHEIDEDLFVNKCREVLRNRGLWED